MPNRSEGILILLGGVAIALVVVIANGERTEYRRIMREHDQEVYRANGWEWPDERIVTSGPAEVVMPEEHRTSGPQEAYPEITGEIFFMSTELIPSTPMPQIMLPHPNGGLIMVPLEPDVTWAIEAVSLDEEYSPALKLPRTWPITPTAPPASPRAPQPTPPEE